MGNSTARPRASANPEMRIYFYEQTSFRTRRKRYKKAPEDLPEDLRYAHMNPKVAAMLLSQERSKDNLIPVFDDGLGEKSLMHDIVETVTNIRDNLDSFLPTGDEGDVLNKEFCQAKLQSKDLLTALALFLYRWKGVYVELPKSLELSLTSTFKDFVGIVLVESREWQLASNKTDALKQQLIKEEKEKNLSLTAVESRPDTSISMGRSTDDGESVSGSRDDRSVLSRPKSKTTSVIRSGLLSEISETNEKERTKKLSVPRLQKLTGPGDKVLASKKDKTLLIKQPTQPTVPGWLLPTGRKFYIFKLQVYTPV